MIGIDTNILVRHITQDDPRQSKKATKLIESLSADNLGFVSLVVLVELNWVLEKAYGLSRADISDVMDVLLRSREIVVERADVVIQAVRAFRVSSADFPDCLITGLSKAAGADGVLTFDAKAAKTAGMTLLG